MLPETPKTFDANALAVESIDSLKDRERRNRDTGAAKYLEALEAQRGTFQMRAEEQTVLSALAAGRGDAVVDVGAGVGRFAMLVAPRVARLRCLDLSSASLDLLSARARAAGLSNIETLTTDLCHVPASDVRFDRAFSIEVVQHIPSHRERVSAVRNVFDMLRPGGRFLITVIAWNRRNQVPGLAKEGFWGDGDRRLYRFYFTRQDLESLMREAGFIDVRLRGVIVLPRQLTRLFPVSWSVLDAWASHLPFSARLGMDLMAVGRKPR